MAGLTRGWRQLQVPSVAPHDLCCSSDGIVQSTAGAFHEGHVAPVTMLKMNRLFSTKSCMEVPLGSSTSGLANVWYACPKRHAGRFPWHAGLTAVPIFFFYYFFCPTSVSILWTICMYVYINTHTLTHVSDCVETVYELPLQPNNRVKYFYTNRERCKVLTGYLSQGRRPGGDWAKTWHWTDICILPLKQEAVAAYCHIFSLAAFLEEPSLEI